MKKKNAKASGKNVIKKEKEEEVKKDKKAEDTQNENVVSFETMTDNEMLDLFVSLQSTSFWQAILKSNRDRDSVIINSLVTLDPFKNPTQAARAQGERTGLYYIETEVNKLLKERKRAEEEE